MIRIREATVGAFVVVIAVGSPGWSAVAPDEVRNGNAASQAAIATLQARVEATIQFNPSQLPGDLNGQSRTDKYVIDYVRGGDKERRKELQGSALGERDAIRDFRNKKGSLFTPKSSPRSVNSALLASDERLALPVQLWEWVLFELPWCKQPLSRLLESAEVKSFKPVTEAGRALIYLDIRDPNHRRYEVWVDPSANYLLRKFVGHCSLPRAEIRVEREVLSFREAKPGVFFPERITHTLVTDGKWFEKAEATLSNIRVNEPLPAGLLKHTFPAGTRVVDEERGIAYFVGRDGESTNVSPFDPSPPSTVVGASTPPSADEEAWPWHRLILIVSAVVVAVGLGVIFWKRRGRRAAV